MTCTSVGLEKLLSDDDIIGLYLDRKENAIAETNRKYGAYLLTIAFNILGNGQDCEECLNDTYLKTWNAIPPAMPRLLRAFLARIMRNSALDRYDETARKKRIPAELCDPFSELEGILPDRNDLDSIVESQAISQVITNYLDTVSQRKLYIFMSRYYFAVPIAQIASKLRCSESTVHKTLSRMRGELRDALERAGIAI